MRTESAITIDRDRLCRVAAKRKYKHQNIFCSFEIESALAQQEQLQHTRKINEVADEDDELVEDEGTTPRTGACS